MLTADTLVPDLLARHPQARAVLDRYGLRGCGGALGPHETLGFFARMHGVEETRLLTEVASAIKHDRAPRDTAAAAGVEDTIYRRYFTAGIVTVLTVGAGWGVWLLWRIGFAGSFTGVSIHGVNAHGHAQIFGWVGLFIMGFAYQALPRFWHARLAAPRLAVAVFAAMLLGITVRTAGMAMHGEPWALSAAMAGGALEIAAIAVFATQLAVTFRRGDAPWEPYLCFVFSALLFFLVQAGFSVWHTATTMTAATREQLLWYVGTYQAVLRDLQIHGLALFMILGVSMRLLPGAYGLPAISRRRAHAALLLLLAAVIGESVVFIAYRWTDNHALAAALMLPWLMLAVGSLLMPWKWKLWRQMPQHDRSSKFIRAAYGWLAVSMAMLLLLPVYQAVSGIPFSHAYYGGIRHAITVGFISLMIMGVAAKVVPTLNGIDSRKLSPLWGPFVLVNVGCLLRVSLQTLTDWHPLFFGVVGVSGVLELTGLAWWGAHLIGVMRRGKRGCDDVEPTAAPRTIEPHHVVADVLGWFPATAPVFDRFGFTLLRNPLLRRTVARQTTLAQAAAMRRVPLAELMTALRDAAGVAAAAALPSLRYDAPVGELLGHYPSLAALVAAHGIDPQITLDKAASLIGWSVDDLIAHVSREAGCTGSCGSCPHGSNGPGHHHPIWSGA